MNKTRIIIDVEEVSLERALECVRAVVNMGRISEAGGVKHYCWHTVFKDGVSVSVRRKRTENSADSFLVRPN